MADVDPGQQGGARGQAPAQHPSNLEPVLLNFLLSLKSGVGGFVESSTAKPLNWNTGIFHITLEGFYFDPLVRAYSNKHVVIRMSIWVAYYSRMLVLEVW